MPSVLPKFGSDRIVVLGLQGYGKTTLVKRMITGNRHIIYDPLKEYSFLNSRTCSLDVFHDELELFGEGYVVFEEASQYLRRSNISQRSLAYFDVHRHMSQSPIIVCRRPVQLHPDVMELATKIFVFTLPGAADRSALESMAPGLGDIARAIPKYGYVWVDEGRKVHDRPLV